ncbi:MAG: hypothetical protein NTV94_16405 [Planctomycetota bacterium]|nr:hypothetical protein [Planctomycetota bacterium]
MANRDQSVAARPSKLGLRLKAAAVLSLLAGATSLSQAQVHVSVAFRPQVISFSPTGSPIYVLFADMQAFGFSDERNAENSASIAAGSGAFTAHVEPGLSSGGSGSYGYSTTLDLSDAINNSGTWTLSITDGAMGTTSLYTMSVTTPGIDDDYLRPIVLDVIPDAPIPASPTFAFSIDAAANADAEYGSAGAAMFANNPGNSVFSPSILPTDTSWTPDGPLNDDNYLLYVAFTNFDCPQWLVQASTPEPLDGPALLETFDTSVYVMTESQAPNLTVGNATPYTVDVIFSPDVLSFNPADPDLYILGVGINATGFVDEFNVDNFIRLESNNGHFSGDIYPARGSGSGSAGSIGLVSLDDLVNDINSNTDWTMRITDGVTGLTHEYSVNISTPGIPADLVRPIGLPLAPDTEISESPTLDFTLDPATQPELEYTYAFAYLIGTLPDTFIASPALSVTDRTWTPDSLLIPDTYTAVIGMTNNSVDSQIFAASSPTGTSPGAPPVNLQHTVNSATFAQRSGLTVSAYCPADFNLDGGVDGSDVSAFFESWEAGDSLADVNRDGGVDGSDIDTFFAAWEAGGC